MEATYCRPIMRAALATAENFIWCVWRFGVPGCPPAVLNVSPDGYVALVGRVPLKEPELKNGLCRPGDSEYPPAFLHAVTSTTLCIRGHNIQYLRHQQLA